MRVSVFRYLSKPLEKQRLFRNLKEALHTYSTLHITVPVETKEQVYAVDINDICSIEIVKRNIIVHTTDTDYVSVQPMSYWLKTLPENCFFQSHLSYIVNLAHVKSFEHTLIQLNCRNLTAYLTRRKYTKFKAAYMLYIESMR